MLPCFVAAGDAAPRVVTVVAAAGYRDWLAAPAGRGRAPGSRARASSPSPRASRCCPAPTAAPDGRAADRERAGRALGLRAACARACRPATGASRARVGPSRPGWRRSAGRSPATASSAIASARRSRCAWSVEAAHELRLAEATAEAVWLARDLINTPASDLGPAELAEAVADGRGALRRQLPDGRRRRSAGRELPGDPRRRPGQPARAAPDRSDAGARRTRPSVTLVGKGVCFDTGGLDLKSSQNMLLMKKDMGGAAVTLGLAQAIMALAAAGAAQAADRRGREQRRAAARSGRATCSRRARA